jgi:hypothetical protein
MIQKVSSGAKKLADGQPIILAGGSGSPVSMRTPSLKWLEESDPLVIQT